MGADLETIFDIENEDIEDEEEMYCISPKELFVIALSEAGLVDKYDYIDNPQIDSAWRIFELLMEKHGYIQDEENYNVNRKLP